MHPTNKTLSSRPLAIVRALALVAAPACVQHEEVPPPPPLVTESSGGVVVQGGVVQSNTVVPQQTVVQGNEQNVEMHTVVVGQQPVCAVGSREHRGNTVCDCVSTGTQAAWRCAAVVAAECTIGTSTSNGRGDCVCADVGGVARWQCDRREYHMVGPLAPPELDPSDERAIAITPPEAPSA